MRSNLRAALHTVARRFAVAQSGNVAVIFAIACIPVVAAMGVAVDYSRGARAASDMQDAVDAASLALSRQTNVGSMTSTQLAKFASDYFNANFHDSEVQNLAVTASYMVTGPSVKVGASGTMPTDFMGIFGDNQMPIARSSTTVWGETLLRVALVLDNTGSMAQYGKLSALKTATHNLLTQLQNAASVDGDVYVSIIPFVKDVNVSGLAGNKTYNASWIKWDGTASADADLWDKWNGTCNASGGRNGGGWWGGWGGWGGWGWGSNPGMYNNEADCTNAGYSWNPSPHQTWNGCIMDRDQSYDTLNTAPTTSSPPTLFPAEQYSSCPLAMMGLTYNWTALGNEVDAMTANGSTNQAIGLAWGWQSLTAAPFTIPAMDPSKVYKQIIILLTDGLNTQDRWYGNGYNTSTQVDARQQILCNNVKAAGITIYTVQVNTDGDPTSTLLQNCASSSDKFFLLTNASQIVTTFQQIGTELSDLRISQ